MVAEKANFEKQNTVSWLLHRCGHHYFTIFRIVCVLAGLCGNYEEDPYQTKTADRNAGWVSTCLFEMGKPFTCRRFSASRFNLSRLSIALESTAHWYPSSTFFQIRQRQMIHLGLSSCYRPIQTLGRIHFRDWRDFLNKYHLERPYLLQFLHLYL